MPPLDISLCMIVKDEEKHLERCLSSVQGLVSEIIVADTGSADQSVTIAKRFGARVLQLPWENDFAKARNETLNRAAGSWILVLDADEEADGWPPDEVAKLLENADAGGYFVQLINYLGDNPGQEYVTDSVCRLFRNDPRIRFRGKIHEEAAQSILELPGAGLSFSSLRIKHYGYLQAEIARKDKNRRNLSLIEQALAEQPEQAILQYALGTEYYQAEQYEKAASLFIPLLQKVPAHAGYLSDLYLKAAYALKMSGQPEKADSVMKEGLSFFPDFADLLEIQVCLFLEQNRYSAAYESLRQALQAGDVSAKYTSSSGSGTYRSHLLAGAACEKMFRIREAADHYFHAIALRPDYYSAWREYVPLCLLLGQPSRLTEYLRQSPQIITPKHLSLLIPAALNGRCSEWLEQLLQNPSLEPPIPAILQALHALLTGDRTLASLLLNELNGKTPGHPMILSYLWAFAWGREDRDEARRSLTLLNQKDCRLEAVQRRLEGDADFPLDEASLVYGLQLLVQTGAWAAVIGLYGHAGGQFNWAKMPQPLLCGLLAAPARVKKELCLRFERNRANGKQFAAIGLSEFVFFSAMAQSCGEFLPGLGPRLGTASQTLPDSPAAFAAMAQHWLARASRIHSGLPAGPNPILLLRACSR